MSDIREIKAEDIQLLDYMLIPVKEYRQLVEDLAKANEQVLRYFDQATEYQRLVAEYKDTIRQLLGIKDLQKKRRSRMISIYDMQCLARLEEQWLDPDHDTIQHVDEDRENYKLLKGDEEWAERVCSI